MGTYYPDARAHNTIKTLILVRPQPVAGARLVVPKFREAQRRRPAACRRAAGRARTGAGAPRCAGSRRRRTADFKSAPPLAGAGSHARHPRCAHVSTAAARGRAASRRPRPWKRWRKRRRPARQRTRRRRALFNKKLERAVVGRPGPGEAGRARDLRERRLLRSNARHGRDLRSASASRSRRAPVATKNQQRGLDGAQQVPDQNDGLRRQLDGHVPLARSSAAPRRRRARLSPALGDALHRAARRRAAVVPLLAALAARPQILVGVPQRRQSIQTERIPLLVVERI